MIGTFGCTLKFIVKDCDPNTGEPDDDGYEDEYVVSNTVSYDQSYYIQNKKRRMCSMTTYGH